MEFGTIYQGAAAQSSVANQRRQPVNSVEAAAAYQVGGSGSVGVTGAPVVWLAVALIVTILLLHARA